MAKNKKIWGNFIKFAADNLYYLENMRVKLHKGLNLRLAGAVTDTRPMEVKAAKCAVIPDDFPGFLPKLDVKEGDPVKVGSVLMHDKLHPEVCLVSPVSGTVGAVVRGERRKILRVEIESDGKHDSERFDVKAPLVELLGRTGLFAMFRNRPYDIVPDPQIRPRDIFVTAIDSAPLALHLAGSLGEDAVKVLETAVKALKKLTDGLVYLSIDDEWPFDFIKGAETVTFEGPHPIGNAGIQIANINPVNKGENVWTLDVVTLYKIGKLLIDGIVDTSCLVAVVGPEVETPYVAKTVAGIEVKSLISKRLVDDGAHKRIISGNVLTGSAVGENGFLRAPFRQVTVIAEGDDVDEFMGWASLSLSKLSVNQAIPFRRLRKLFSPDARLNGGRRAMILSGEYDKVMPADILPEYLLKAIISKNIDDMEALGIYEVAPEDFALCEFVDASKLPIQQIVRDGLDYLRKELS